jgi:hypothetical protein
LARVGEDRHQQRRDTVAAGVSDQAAQLAVNLRWSVCCEPAGEFGIRDCPRQVMLGTMSGHVGVTGSPRPLGGSACTVLRCRRHDATIVMLVRREEKYRV